MSFSGSWVQNAFLARWKLQTESTFSRKTTQLPLNTERSMRKICSRCNQMYAPSKSQIKHGGGWCRPCLNAYNRAQNLKKRESGVYDLDKNLAYQRQYRQRPGVLERLREAKKEYNKRPDVKLKNSARGKLKYAVKTGCVQRLSCEVCGDENTDAHHTDYSRPLDVRWLCRIHHVAEHKPHFYKTPPERRVLPPHPSPVIKKQRTHCFKGHEFTDDNIYIQPSRGTRSCRKCREISLTARRNKGKSNAVS